MSKREMALFRVAMQYADAFYGTMNVKIPAQDLANKVVLDTQYEFDEDDIAECCEDITGS